MLLIFHSWLTKTVKTRLLRASVMLKTSETRSTLIQPRNRCNHPVKSKIIVEIRPSPIFETALRLLQKALCHMLTWETKDKKWERDPMPVRPISSNHQIYCIKIGKQDRRVCLITMMEVRVTSIHNSYKPRTFSTTRPKTKQVEILQ